MSHVSISRSYAVLVGLEAYVKTRKRGKKAFKKLIHSRDKLLSPEEVAKQDEEARDKSESAAIERRFLEMKLQAEEDERHEHRATGNVLAKLHLNSPRGQKQGEEVEAHGVVAKGKAEGTSGTTEADIEVPGRGPENAIAPDGSRRLEA